MSWEGRIRKIEAILLQHGGKYLVKNVNSSICDSVWIDEANVDEQHLKDAFEKRREKIQLNPLQSRVVDGFGIPEFSIRRILGQKKDFDHVPFRKIEWKGLGCSTFEPVENLRRKFSSIQPPPPPPQVDQPGKSQKNKEKEREIFIPPPPSSCNDVKESKKRKRTPEVVETKGKESEEVAYAPPKKKRKIDVTGILIKDVKYGSDGKLGKSKVLMSNVENGKASEDSKWLEYKDFKRHVKRYFTKITDQEEEEVVKEKKKKKKKKKYSFVDIDDHDDV